MLYTVPVGVSTVITLRGYQLDIATQLALEMKNTDVLGLLGNYNGNSTDDFISRYGRTIPADSTEETIYYEFGETCELLFIIDSVKLFYAKDVAKICLSLVVVVRQRAARKSFSSALSVVHNEMLRRRM